MKLVVPLTMPATHSMRLAVSPSRSALMIGMPPATAASNPIITPLACAAAKISLPCTASSALLAVTTCLPLAMASSTRVLAVVGAADQLDHDVDGRVGDDAARIVDHLRRVADDAARTREVEVGHRGDADLAPGTALDLFLIALQHLECAAADRADAEQADLDRFGFDITSLRDMSLRRTTSCCHLALLDR